MNILEIQCGSHLYGTNTPESDTDYVGIYIPSYMDYLLSNEFIKEKDMSTISKTDGKNNKDAIDKKFYSYRRFIDLAISNTPNILEILFVNQENVISMNTWGKRLIANRHQFLHKGLIKRFVGYSDSQYHKMQIKTDKYNEMQLILNYLNTVPGMKVLAELQYDEKFAKVLEECSTKEIKQDQTIKKVIRVHDKYLTIGDLNIPMNVYVKNAVKRIEDRLAKATNRSELITKYGFDVKFGSNLIRLLIEGKELIETRTLEFPLKEKELILDIKKGRYTANEIFNMRDELLKEIKSLEKTTQLPDTIDVDKILKWYETEMIMYTSFMLKERNDV